MPIRLLPAAIAARIAAGEVVERPASVVKELVENALDADARRITVELLAGGLELISVADDGSGIAGDEVELAFERHATSKLERDDDLLRLQTLGFRGEALPSVAAVAEVTLSTRRRHDPEGTLLRYQDGQPVERRALGRGAGTTVEVRDLFARQPARRKFLRSRAAEAAQVVQLVGQLALAYPEVAFRLLVDGKEAVSTDGAGDRAAAAAAVLGREVARDLLPIRWQSPEEWPSPIVVEGLAGHRGAHRANRGGIAVFVNRRAVEHRALTAAVEDAYRTLIPTGRHPVVVLDLRLDPGAIDPNVHPAKREVRLLYERAAFSAVQRALHAALSDAGVARAFAAGDDETDGSQPLRGLRVLGQVGHAYIIAEGEAGLYLVDQHAAHERVLHEELALGQLGGQATQLLLEPLSLDLGAAGAALAGARSQELRDAGFDVEPFGTGTLLVRSVPVVSRPTDPYLLARDVISTLASEDGPVPDWRERIRVVASCKAAVRAGDALSHEEMLALLERLGEQELCRTCSHGRPTALLLSHRQLEQEFGRR